MSIKIYFPKKIITLCTPEESKDWIDSKNQTIINDDFENKIPEAIRDIAKQNILIIHDDITHIQKLIRAQFTVIEAAGGLVQNDTDEILFIYRRGKWDLPKGKKEDQEDIAQCAEREIEEETGVKNLRLLRKITETYHVYDEKEKTILKISHWFHFRCTGDQNLVPQIEEDITAIRWVGKNDIKDVLNDTYETIADVIYAAEC
jgi:8-oxo-dGTP pyrophosphatase MutT (NUDIX family)